MLLLVILAHKNTHYGDGAPGSIRSPHGHMRSIRHTYCYRLTAWTVIRADHA